MNGYHGATWDNISRDPWESDMSFVIIVPPANDNSHSADVLTPLAVYDIGIIVNPILISPASLRRARNNVRR